MIKRWRTEQASDYTEGKITEIGSAFEAGLHAAAREAEVWLARLVPLRDKLEADWRAAAKETREDGTEGGRGM